MKREWPPDWILATLSGIALVAFAFLMTLLNISTVQAIVRDDQWVAMLTLCVFFDTLGLIAILCTVGWLRDKS